MTADGELVRLWRRPWVRMAALCLTAAATGIGLFWCISISVLFASNPGETAEIFRTSPGVVTMFIIFWVIAVAGTCLTWFQARWMLDFLWNSEIVAVSGGTDLVDWKGE